MLLQSHKARFRVSIQIHTNMELASYISIITALFVISLFSLLIKKKPCPPGPLGLPIIGHLHLLNPKIPVHHTMNRFHARFGPILSLHFGSRKVIVVGKGALAEECLLSNGVVFVNRPKFPSLKDLSYDFSILGITNYGPHWSNLRKIAASEVSALHSLQASADIRTSELHSLIRTLFLESNVDGGLTKVELKSRLLAHQFNNLLRMIAGKRFSNDKNSPDAQEQKAFHKWVDDFFDILCGRSNIADFLPSLAFIGSKQWAKKVAYMTNFREEFFQKLIEDVKQNTADEYKKSIVAHMLSLQDVDPKYYTDEFIKGFAVSMVGAGTDTVSNTIEWALTLLLNNPDKLEKLKAEIDEKIGNGRLVEESDVQNLPYLVRVTNETLRLKPAAPITVPHEASEDCVVGGYEIEKGTMLLLNAYRMHRDPEMFPDPEKFEPERYGEGKNEVSKMLIFGMGRMRCPGEALARRVVGSVLGCMVQCFDWEKVEEGTVDMTESLAVAMGKEIPLEAMYRPREKMLGVLRAL